jgi:argininosuccinate lyase
MKKLWEKGYSTNNLVEKFTVGNDRIYDLKLAKFDVQGNIAHAKMLESIGILTQSELNQLMEALNIIANTIENQTFVIEDSFEDVHSKIEFELTQMIGETGKKIHTARSRNDQVLLDLHLYVKDEIMQMKELIMALFNTLLSLSEQYKNVLMPGYTHTQIAMPSSFGLFFSAYAESLVDDLYFLNAAYKVANQNPLGSAAGYGSSFPINRTLTSELLGFETMKYNVVAAQMSRGKLEKSLAFGLSSLAATLSKLADDIILFMSQNFGFIGFPKEFTTGSSIMPHKQNPDVFELLRAKCNKIQSLPNEISFIINNLTSGYHRDYQLLKANIMDAVDVMKDNLEMLNFVLPYAKINEHILESNLYDYLYSVEEVNKLVIQGMSFREAYQKLGKEILEGNFMPEKKVEHTHQGSIGNLCLNEIRVKFEKAFDS